MRLVALRDTDTIVLNLEYDLIAYDAHIKAYLSAMWRIFERVVQQIDQYLSQQLSIRDEASVLAGKSHLQLMLRFCSQSHFFQDILCKGLQINEFPVNFLFPGVRLVESQNVINQMSHLPHRSSNAGKKFLQVV